jgi:hypothetical protein
MKHVTTYFETYPEKNEVFETSDGFLFHKDTDAKNHSVTLKDKDVATHKRKDVIKSDAKDAGAGEGDKKPAKAAKPAKKNDEGDKTPGADKAGAGDDGKGGDGNTGAGAGDNAGE